MDTHHTDSETSFLANRLKAALTAQNLSAAAVGRQTGISVASLSRILSGQTSPTFETVAKLAEALGLPLDSLAPKPAAALQATAGSHPLMAVFSLENTDANPDAAGAMMTQAARGSWVGSWTEPYTDPALPQPVVQRAIQVGTRRLEVTLAFPHMTIERGSLAGILSVVGSALTGTGAKLLDVHIPTPLIRTFAGPAFGLRGIRDTFNKHGRPMLAATMRPMHGLSPRMYGRAVYEALLGGVDVTADPTMLHHIPTNPWRERFRFVAEAVIAANQDTNEFKAHALNITAATLEDMQERAVWARDLEMSTVMVDSAAIGMSALQSMAAFCQKNELILCAMGGRALAGDMLSEQLQAKLLRFAGADVVSTGSPLRGNVANRRYVMGVMNALRDDTLPVQPDMGHYTAQGFEGLTGSLPAVGGGHNPWHFPRLLDATGGDVMIQCGGSVMGHPQGSQAGATACRTAIEALVQARGEGQNLNVDGRHILAKAAKYSPELRAALDAFQEGSYLFGVVHSLPRPTEGSVIPHGINPSPTITPFKRPEPTTPKDEE